MRILTFTNLYPSSVQPIHGVFVEQRLLRLVDSGRVEARVLAPVPWFPFRHARFGRYGEFARIPRDEMRHGIAVHHPRYPLPPGIGMELAPLSMALATWRTVRQLHREWGFDFIDAHYLYPDGVAASLLGQWLKVPVVHTARGSDVNVLANHALPRRWMRWALRRSAAVITVSGALAEAIRSDIEPAANPRVIPNGVDLNVFAPHARDSIRQTLGLGRYTLLLVGKLTAAKGQHLAIEALRELSDCELLLIGEGPDAERLRQRAAQLAVGDRVRFLGAIEHRRLPSFYSAADVTLLPSEREGMPNVVLESLACGTPVVASRVGGIPEILTDELAGALLAERSTPALVAAINRVRTRPPSRTVLREHARRFDWAATVSAQLEVFSQVKAMVEAGGRSALHHVSHPHAKL